jgi:hypothetical protein
MGRRQCRTLQSSPGTYLSAHDIWFYPLPSTGLCSEASLHQRVSDTMFIRVAPGSNCILEEEDSSDMCNRRRKLLKSLLPVIVGHSWRS